jgi:phosphohistidine phosphatase SixA
MSRGGSWPKRALLRPLAWIAAAALCIGALQAAAPGTPDASQALSGARLADALKGGGFVIYFRHADTGPAYAEQGRIDLDRCETQRNLNDKGRAEAREIGRQFRRLGVPVGVVLSSEYCRCWQTAELAFGRFEKTSMLTGRSRDPAAAESRKQAAAGLRKLLGTPPAAGTNTILVSHGFNLIDAEGFHLATQGEAAVFDPDGDGGYALVARVTPDEWARLPGP